MSEDGERDVLLAGKCLQELGNPELLKLFEATHAATPAAARNPLGASAYERTPVNQHANLPPSSARTTRGMVASASAKSRNLGSLNCVQDPAPIDGILSEEALQCRVACLSLVERIGQLQRFTLPTDRIKPPSCGASASMCEMLSACAAGIDDLARLITARVDSFSLVRSKLQAQNQALEEKLAAESKQRSHQASEAARALEQAEQAGKQQALQWQQELDGIVNRLHQLEQEREEAVQSLHQSQEELRQSSVKLEEEVKQRTAIEAKLLAVSSTLAEVSEQSQQLERELASSRSDAEAARIASTYFKQDSLSGVPSDQVDLARRCDGLLHEIKSLREENARMGKENAVLESKIVVLQSRSKVNVQYAGAGSGTGLAYSHTLRGSDLPGANDGAHVGAGNGSFAGPVVGLAAQGKVSDLFIAETLLEAQGN